MLICLLQWDDKAQPTINFLMGDRPSLPTNNDVIAAPVNPLNVDRPLAGNDFLNPQQGVRLATIHDQAILKSAQREAINNDLAKTSNNWRTATDDPAFTDNLLQKDMQMMMSTNEQLGEGTISPFKNAFTLLDVSTNADLMGVSLGFSNDRFVMNKTHTVAEDNANPISISGLDVQANSRLVQLYALPQISWEPVINLSAPVNDIDDPYPGLLYFLNDGVPAQIANTGNEPVTLAPLPLSSSLGKWYVEKAGFAAWSFFTLPYGMLALAKYQKQADGNNPGFELMKLKFPGELFNSLQVKTTGLKDEVNNNRKFFGSAHQLRNSYNLNAPSTGARSILAGSVTEIFNREFGDDAGLNPAMYVPLERYDFSGYGANVFSHWLNANADVARTSQALFDVWRGRTAHEIIQVRSLIYPWGIRVVRTITIYRGSNGFPWRIDSGWKAESDGIYDFRTKSEPGRNYTFHPGIVDGVYNVRNIKEDTTLLPFIVNKWMKKTGVYIDNFGQPKMVEAGGHALDIKLVPVYFDADVQIDDVVQGGSKNRVLSQRMLGYLQLAPKGVIIEDEQFAGLLTLMNGLGGPVECTVNVNRSLQQMRITRVEVNPSIDEGGQRVFVTAAKGAPVLPKDGSWSVVQHDAITKEVTPLQHNEVVPLIRKGQRVFPVADRQTYTQDKETNPLNIAASTELFKALESRAHQFAFLQSTGENKVLFRNPLFEPKAKLLKGSVPDLADAYRLMNSKGIFPKLEDLPKLSKIGDLPDQFGLTIIDEGYKLVNNTLANAGQKLVQELPPGPWYIVKTNDVKVYIDYKPTKPNPADNPAGKKALLDFDIDSQANQWLNKMNDVTMVVDLGTFDRLMLIRGSFNTDKNSPAAFVKPELEFGPALKPVVDILVLLGQLAIDPSYKNILEKGLKVAMSNSPNNWEYKFQADKEIPVLKFPPPPLDAPLAPLRLEASLKVGVYFNVALPMPIDNPLPVPSAGAFVEFYGKLSVMCLSVGVGTIYAVGQVTVRINADTVSGAGLYMKVGFGVEAVVGLPVIGNVSVYFAVGVEISINATAPTFGAFVLFKGRADILGGVVTITIMIEASGKVQDRIGEETNMIAQVTFSLDISICFVIDISFSETWSEQRQIS
jgi:hypothetical protein